MSPQISFVLIFALLSGQALASAVKGIQQQQQQQPLPQRAVEQAPIKSPVQVQQSAERQPKAASPGQPILESSKKVYNDESIRRSAASQQKEQSVAISEPAAKSAAPVQPIVAVQPAVVGAPAAVPVAQPAAAPVVVAQPEKNAVIGAQASAPVPVIQKPAAEPAPIEPKKIESPIEAKSEPAKQAKPAEAPAAKDELPVQSVRSAPIKEAEPASKVIVEQVVPAKVVEQSPAAAVAPAAEPVKPAVIVEQVVPMMPVVHDSALQAKKDEQTAPLKPVDEPAPIEVPAPDPGLVLSEPIDSTTKLLIDLDEHVQKFLPAEDKQEASQPAKDQVLVSGVDYSPAEDKPSGKSDVPLVPYSSSPISEHEPIVPPLPQSIEKVEKASGAVAPASSSVQQLAPAQAASNSRQASSSSSHQHQNQQQVINQLLEQLDSLQTRIQDTINQLVARRRYVMSALLRPMGTYVRRVRSNLERLQNRVNQLQAAASSVGGNQNGQRPGGLVDAAAIETIRRRIDDISKRISDIVNRIRFSLTPTSAPMNNGK